jgi:hypothetical protein
VSTLLLIDLQRIRQLLDGTGEWLAGTTALDVAQGPDAQAGPLGEFFLGQAGIASVLAQEPAEVARVRTVAHARSVHACSPM